jgi:hypothetical protein
MTLNGSSIYNDCAVTNCGINVTDTYSTSRNFMSCKLKNRGDDTWLFMEGAGSPGKIVAENDEGGIRSDGYPWLYSSLATTSTQTYFGFVALYSFWYSSPFECDLYFNLRPTTTSLQNDFPNLALDNSFISDHYTSSYPYGYNCVDWSVGISAYPEYIVPGNWRFYYNLNDWDNFYDTKGYTRTGADANNAAIALWMNGEAFTHASVRKNSTIPVPHGFEWESKSTSQQCLKLERQVEATCMVIADKDCKAKVRRSKSQLHYTKQPL